MDNPRLAYLRDKVKKLPLQPGIYIMKDKKGQIIYIGVQLYQAVFPKVQHPAQGR